jgi:hypothetical protein
MDRRGDTYSASRRRLYIEIDLERLSWCGLWLQRNAYWRTESSFSSLWWVMSDIARGIDSCHDSAKRSRVSMEVLVVCVVLLSSVSVQVMGVMRDWRRCDVALLLDWVMKNWRGIGLSVLYGTV